MNKVVTRFPPSPTGYFHIGSARTALFNYLFTAHHGGTMYLRFEDTDRARSKKEYEDDILAGLDWLHIGYTKAEPLRQSERLEIYRTYLHRLIEKGAAYEAESAEDGKGNVIRFRNPNIHITFSDLIRGKVSFDTTELKDFIIARGIDDPLYHMAVVADDHDMGITHVIRGEDHISNTPRQILILEALGFERPIYAHIPLILAADRSKLSKRHGAVSINEYRKDGYVPEALVNYLALLGWNPGGEQEIFTLDELVQTFSIEQAQRGGAIFNVEKLRWFNAQYLSRFSAETFAKGALQTLSSALEARGIRANEDTLKRLAASVRERVSVWSDLTQGVENGEYDYFFIEPQLEASKIPGKGSDAAAARKHLAELRKLLEPLSSERDITPSDIKGLVWEYAEQEGRGAVLWPFRYALAGREKSPDPFTIAAIIGKEATLRRIDCARKALQTL